MKKAAFIRQHPNATPDQVSKLAKRAGLVITAAYVQNVRAYDKPRDKKPKARKPTLTKTEPKVIKMSDLNLDPTFNQRARLEPSEPSEALKVSGDGLVRAFKAMVVAIGTRVARQLVTQVEDETSKLFGRPPL